MFGKPHDRAILAMHAHNWLESAANERMLAIELALNHTYPRLRKKPFIFESWKPPFVCTRRTWSLGRMSDNMEGLLKTEIVDWVSKRIHELGMPA